MKTFLGGWMKTSDLICEHRGRTIGYKVDIELTEDFIALYKNDEVEERKRLVNKALHDLFGWYNYKNVLEGKIKINNNSSDCFHYHFGYPSYMISPNGNYSTSDWFILFKLKFDYDRDMFIILPYDYDHHNRRGNWNI